MITAPYFAYFVQNLKLYEGMFKDGGKE